MTKYHIKLRVQQMELLREILKRASLMELFNQPEWVDDWLILRRLYCYSLNKYISSEILLIGSEPWAIMKFLSCFINEDRPSVSAVTHYKHMKLFQQIFWQSSYHSGIDPEDWQWFIISYNPDTTPQIRKW